MAGDEGVIGDSVSVGRVVEHFVGVGEIGGFDVHVDEAVGEEEGGVEAGGDHEGVG